ncbi:MAG: hypothetical protein HMLKMBBP_01197 [Planctomycetes bacterium]|nr:hypothetical protein [Planctomycetota bacterium]
MAPVFLNELFDDPVSWSVTVAVVVGSIVLHELGHGIAALAEGDSTPRIRGHMTWNPVVHMGWLSIGLVAVFGIGWGMMPVNPSMFRHRRWGDALVAAAGPLVNVALVLVAACVLAFTDPDAIARSFGPDRSIAVLFWVQVLVLNSLLAIFNLIPLPPLDGFTIFDSFVELGNVGAWLRAMNPLPLILAIWLLRQGLDDWALLRALDLTHAIRGIF